MKTLTTSQMAAADAAFEDLLTDFKARRPATAEPNPHDYFVYKALWARAHGADAVCVVSDPQ